MGTNPSHPPRCALSRTVLAVLLVAPFAFSARLSAQTPAELSRLTYTKIMKGSVPEYLRISVDSSGAGTFEGRSLSSPPNPDRLQLSPDVTERLFGLAEALGDFRSIQLESHKKVADLGQKTFTYQKGDKTYQAEFNYTLNRKAQELADVFERIAGVEEHIGTLEYSVRYDHLGLPHELRLIEIDLDNHNLADPQLMVPILKQIASDPRFLHIAQIRAQDILQRIQSQ